MTLSGIFPDQVRCQNVLPNERAPYHAGVRLSDVELLAYIKERTPGVENFNNLFFGKSGAVVVLSHRSQFGASNQDIVYAALNRRRTVSSFSDAIMRIVFVRSQKQMAWVYARRVVALVKHVKAIGYGASKMLKRVPVRQHVPLGRKAKDAVSGLISWATPFPAWPLSCLLKVRQKFAFQAAKLCRTSHALKDCPADFASSFHLCLHDWRVI
jgi:hypothetical protein